MTVGYYTGTSTGPNDLLSKLRTALTTEGWTEDGYAAIGAGYRLHVHKNLSSGLDMYFNFRSAIAETGTTLIAGDNSAGANGTVTGLIINGSTGYDAGELWHQQPGYTTNSSRSNASSGNCMTPMSTSAIPSYHFFFVGDSVHIVVEVTAGEFQMMSFGGIVKQGVFTGGQYFSASHSTYAPVTAWTNRYAPRYLNIATSVANGQAYDQAGFLYIDADSSLAWRRAFYGGNAYAGYRLIFNGAVGSDLSPYDGSALAKCFISSFSLKSPSSYNSMAAMCPVYMTLHRSDDNFSLVGWPEGVRFLNVTLYSAGEEITYGDETWMAFPSNGFASPLVETTYYPHGGFAFLKDDGS